MYTIRYDCAAAANGIEAELQAAKARISELEAALSARANSAPAGADQRGNEQAADGGARPQGRRTAPEGAMTASEMDRYSRQVSFLFCCLEAN